MDLHLLKLELISKEQELGQEVGTFSLVDTEAVYHFKGVVVVAEQTFSDTAHSDYSGLTGIGEAMTVYISDKLNIICEYKFHTQWQGCTDYHRTEVVDTPEEIVEFFTRESGKCLDEADSRCLRELKLQVVENFQIVREV